MQRARIGDRARITFVSSNRSWGGSEELWAAAAARLAAAGHDITVYKSDLAPRHRAVRKLRELPCRLVDLRFGARRLSRIRLVAALASSRLGMAREVARLWLALQFRRRPDLVVLSQGGNHDGWPLIAVCRALGLRYVILSHKASDLYWPPDAWRDTIRRGFESAASTFFVAEHNLRLTEQQIGTTLPNASLVRNPFNVPWARPLPWPSTATGFRLGCIARFNIKEKGQDLLLRVLAAEKWQARALSVTFLGEGDQRHGLEEMALSLGLSSVRFAGHTEDLPGFWAEHHALILPSRAEGLPLVLVEAMLCGRPSIVTDVGGNAELVEDGLTGFVAEAPTEKSVDDALERAWSRRHEWAALGGRAADHARTMVPADPAGLFAERLLAVAAGDLSTPFIEGDGVAIVAARKEPLVGSHSQP